MLTPELVEEVAQLFALVQMMLTGLGVWGLIPIFLSAILIIRLGVVLIAMIRSRPGRRRG